MASQVHQGRPVTGDLDALRAHMQTSVAVAVAAALGCQRPATVRLGDKRVQDRTLGHHSRHLVRGPEPTGSTTHQKADLSQATSEAARAPGNAPLARVHLETRRPPLYIYPEVHNDLAC